MIDQNFVKKAYGKKEVIDAYSKLTLDGLWESEKILFNKFLPKKQLHILDVGCGTGRASFPLSDMNNNVIVGIDITPEMINEAKRLNIGNKVNFEIGDILKTNFKDKIFDAVVFSYNGLNTIPGEKNRLKALLEINRILKDDGVFIFSSHIRQNFDGLLIYWLKQFIKIKLLPFLNKEKFEIGDRLSFRLGRYQYINLPRLSTIVNQLNESNFKIIFSDFRTNMSEIEKNNDDYPVMMFVCKKINK